jgi:hypothetical protein
MGLIHKLDRKFMSTERGQRFNSAMEDRVERSRIRHDEKMQRAATAPEPQVIVEPYGGINHRANIVMCFITLGVWIPVYGILWMIHGSRKRRIVER